MTASQYFQDTSDVYTSDDTSARPVPSAKFGSCAKKEEPGEPVQGLSIEPGTICELTMSGCRSNNEGELRLGGQAGDSSFSHSNTADQPFDDEAYSNNRTSASIRVDWCRSTDHIGGVEGLTCLSDKDRVSGCNKCFDSSGVCLTRRPAAAIDRSRRSNAAFTGNIVPIQAGFGCAETPEVIATTIEPSAESTCCSNKDTKSKSAIRVDDTPVVKMYGCTKDTDSAPAKAHTGAAKGGCRGKENSQCATIFEVVPEGNTCLQKDSKLAVTITTDTAAVLESSLGIKKEADVVLVKADDCCGNNIVMGAELSCRDYVKNTISCEAVETDDEDQQGERVCSCCLPLLLSVGKSALPPSKPLVTRLSPMISAETDRILRQCCQLFEQFCSRKSCCFMPMPLQNAQIDATTVSRREKKVNVTSASRSIETKKCGEKFECGSSNKDKRTIERLDEKDNASFPASLRTLSLDVSGMDCASCTGKVNRALSMLSSVHRSNFDYFTAKATLVYDPELIDPEAIAKYVARATGFGVTPSMASGDAEDGGKNVYSLPTKFGIKPDHKVLDANGITMTKHKGYYTISFTMDPRPAMDLLKDYQPSLLPWSETMELSDAVKQDLARACIKSIASSICVVPILVFAWADLDHRKRNIYNGLSLGFTSIIMLIGQSIFSSSVRSILYLRQVDTSLLVGVSTIVASIYSVCAYSLQLDGIDFDEPFFETPALLLTLVLIGHAVQAFARKSSGSAIRALRNLQTDQATLVQTDGTIEQIDIRLLQYGDIIRVRKDEAVGTDGIVVKGETWADESSTSGESVPVPKRVGNNLIAGSVIVGPGLDFQVTRLVHENFLSRLQNLVSDAQQSRSSVQDLADRTAAVILPVSAFGACIAFLAWSVISRFVRKQTPQDSAVSGLTYFIAVLVVACPCALVLVIPLITAVVMQIGLRQGVVFRSNESLWASRHVDVVAFDKTGTLTQGQLAVVDFFLIGEACDLVAALVQNQPHPVAKAVSEWLVNEESTKIRPLELEVENVLGQGLKAAYHGFVLRGGSQDFVDENGGTFEQKEEALSRLTGYTMFYVTLGGNLIAYFALQDQPRPESFDLVRELQNMGKEVIVISGDLPGPVLKLASQLGIPPDKAYARQSPGQKLEILRRLQHEGKKVCYTGDGSNDSPALAQADAAFAISGGTEAAKGAAGAVIFANDIRTGILSALRLAQLNKLHVIAGLAWSIIYNIFALLLASGAFVKVRIAPAYAGLGEVASVLPVVAIAFGVHLTWKYKLLV